MGLDASKLTGALLRCHNAPTTLKQPAIARKPAQEGSELEKRVDTPVIEGEVRFTVYGNPMGKPRMTQRDKWAKRPCVLRYREWADKIRAAIPENMPKDPISVSWTAYLPIPKSHSAKKAEALRGQLHRQKFDRDNIDKGVLDSLLKDDCRVAQGALEKRWDDGNGPRIEIIVK